MLLSAWATQRKHGHEGNALSPLLMCVTYLGCALLSCRSDALSTLASLRSGGWLTRRLSAVMLQFTLFSPVSNLFTSVTMLAEQRPTGVLQPSAKIHTVRVYYTPALWDYVVMVMQVKSFCL